MPYENVASLDAKGVDLETTYSLPTREWGNFTWRLNVTRVESYDMVKLAVRIREAEKEVESDPNRPEYLLHDELRKFRRYKRGLGRYRIIFCFSSKPPIIIFLYLNTAETLRKAGSRQD